MAMFSGDSDYKSMPAFTRYDEVKMGGSSGVFNLTRFSKDKVGDAYESVKCEEPVKVVFLKVRRKLVEFEEKTLVRTSHEYNSPKQLITLSDGSQGEEKELKKQFPKLKAHIVIYALYKHGGETMTVKIPVSGSSLFTDDDDQPLRFYNYMQTFGKDEFTFEYMTVMKSSAMQGDNGTYYAMEFARGEKLDDSALMFVEKSAEKLAGEIESEDASNAKRLPKIWSKAEAAVDKKFNDLTSGSEIAYPEEDINPDDIPF